MAQQLVYTSAAKLLDAGRSGFGTVARSKALSPLVVSAIERVSQFANLRGTDRTRVIFVHRRIIAANNRLHVLSRITDAGADYTGRTNHIAHHLIVSQEEMARAAACGLSPADIILQFPWLDRWEGAARFFAPSDDVAIETFQPLGRESARREWSRVTGNPAHARLLAWDGASRNGVLLVPQSVKPIPLLAEALAELGTQSWSRTFTTSLESTDEMSDLDWIVTTPEVFREIQSRCGARPLLDLTQAQSLPVPPDPVLATPQVEAAPKAANQLPGLPGTTYQIPFSENLPTSPAPFVKVRTGGGLSSRPSTSSPSVSGSRKMRTQIILASVVLILALGLFGVVVLKKIRSEDDKKAASVAEQREKDAATKILNDAGIPDKQIKIFLNSQIDKPKEWAQFTASFLGATQAKDQIAEIGQLTLPASIRSNSLSWLGSLKEARDAGLDWSNKSKDMILTDRLKLISIISIHLHEAAKVLKMDDFSKSCDKLVNQLIKDSLENQDVSKIPVTDVSNLLVAKYDREIFKKAVEYHNDPAPKKSLLEADLEAIKRAEFIPDAIKKSLQDRHAKIPTTKPPAEQSKPDNQPVKETPDGPVLAGVKEKEVIVVSRDELKNGVEVELLKRLLNHPDSGEKIKSLGLVIKVGNNDPFTEIKSVKKFDPTKKEANMSEYFESDSKESSLKIQKNGEIMLDEVDVWTIEIFVKRGDEEYKTWIVIDGEKDEPLDNKLKLQSELKGADEVQITGELAKWMGNVTDGNRKKFELKAVVPGFVFKEKNNEYFLSRNKISIPLLFADTDVKKLKEDLDLLEKKDEAISRTSGGSKKKELNKSRLDLIETLKESLSTAIGGGILLRELGFTDHKQISKEKWGDAKKVLEKFKIKRSLEIKDDWVKDLADIKKKIGVAQLNDIIKKESAANQSPKDWDDLAKGQIGMLKFIDDLILKSKTYKPQSPIAEDLQNVSSITVCTKKGRVLFKATK